MTPSGQAASALVVIEGVTVDVPGRKGLLDRIDLTVTAGDRVAVVGPSGAGKSTLLAVIGGLIDPDDGAVAHHGLAPGEILLLSQHTLVLPFRSVMVNAAIAGLAFGRSWHDCLGRAEAACAAVGLAGVRHSEAGGISGGERQRLGLARALVGDYRLVLADEPTASLDGDLVARVGTILAEGFPPSCAVVVATHDARVATRVGRHVVIDRGRLLAGR